MKRLLIGLASVFLVPTAILPTIYVISCSNANSKEINQILQLTGEKIIDKERYAPVNNLPEGLKAVSFQTLVAASFPLNSNNNSNKPEESLPELLNHQKVSMSDLIKIYNQSYELFKEAKTNFGKLLWIDNEQKYIQTLIQWKFLLLEDYSSYGNHSKEWTYEFESKVLEILEDQILTPLFQLTVAQFAILRHNYIYTKKLEKYLELEGEKTISSLTPEEKQIYENVGDMNSFLEKGYFIPLFKVILMENVRSKGSSRTKIIFDKNLYNFLNVGRHSFEDFLIDEDTKVWVYDKDGKLISDENIKPKDYANSGATELNDIEVQSFYLYDKSQWDLGEDK